MVLTPPLRWLACVLCLLALPTLVMAQPSTNFAKRLADVEALAASLAQTAAELRDQNSVLNAKVASLSLSNTGLTQQVATQAGNLTALQAALAKAVSDTQLYADSVGSTALASAKSYSDTRLQPVVDKLIHVTRSGNNVYITGANLHVRNGLGSTTAAGTNSLGNLIVGYNESRGTAANPDVRTGSHNIITGMGSNYSRAAAFMTGINNSSSGNYASVLGGTGNFATGVYAVVVGGFNNQANGNWSTILGGRDVVAGGQLQRVP